MGGMVEGAHALEIGCGCGVGVDLILQSFGAASVDAFDLDRGMVVQAKERLSCYGENVRLWVGDTSSLGLIDMTYDAVFDFGIIHHVPSWRGAVREVYRVLKPGGLFYGEEVLRSLLDNPLARRLFEHPRNDRFDGSGFLNELGMAGFEIEASREYAGLFVQFVARRPVSV